MVRQASYEQALQKQGIAFEYVDKVPLDQINHTRGKQMQARLEPLDHNLIDNYADMIADGFEPPPLLLWKLTNSRSLLVPLDGNQRIAANQQVSGRKQLKAFSAYVITTDDLMLVDRLCWSFNNLVNGRRLSYEECLEHAITFHRKYGQPYTQAAKEWGVKVWELQAATVALELRELAEAHGVKVPANTPRDTLVPLNVLRKLGDDLAVKAIDIVANSGATHPQVAGLVKSVNEARNHADKLRVIEVFATSDHVLQRRAETKNGKVRSVKIPRHQLQSFLDRLEYLIDLYPDKKAFTPVGKEDKEKYINVSRKIANSLINIYGLGSYLGGE